MITNVKHPFALSENIQEASDFERAFTFNRQGKFNVKPVEKEYDAVSTLPISYIKLGNFKLGATPGEIVIADPFAIKSILGNNGMFSENTAIFYK